ncbi:multicopper oxidase family protein [Calothrix sp. CCY 0018]|uniref:multicopper oxidase family protein n=1 Tax=Calothrix sp. CCY 0018 TaxID=3103864 RepID=UPI0039C5D2A1
MSPTYNPPTIVVSPSNFIDLTLTNDLPVNVELEGKLPLTEQNLESVSQDTNLHYHGFNVSPLLGSDDVVMHVHSNVTPKKGGSMTPDSKHGTITNLPGGIYPGDSYPNNKYGATTEYHMQVNIPEKHQSGLFWYHPHVHTVSNNQVRTGMSGGIIIKDERSNVEDSDTFPIVRGIKLTPASTYNKKSQPRNLSNITQQVMMFKDFNDVLGDEETHPDCFTLNGQLNPKITIQPGEVQFWRIGNIGADNYLNLALETTNTSNPAFVEPNKRKNFIILGRDGGSVKNPELTDSVLIPPASRVDLLVVGGDSSDTYNLVSDFTTNLTKMQQQWVNKPNQKSYQLVTVTVGGEEVCYKTPDGRQLTPDGSHCKTENSENLYDYITEQESKVDLILPDPVELASYTQCQEGEEHSKCITLKDAYPNEPLTQERSFTFNTATLKDPKDPTKSFRVFTINDELYDENRIDKVSHLGDIEEWQVVNPTDAPHAFHMHQLDYLVTQVKLQEDPGSTYDNYKIKNGKCTKNKDDTYTCELESLEYRDMINLPPNSTTTIRIPFLNPFITGVFVYHCHILDHEDKGMMQNLKVIDPKSYK